MAKYYAENAQQVKTRDSAEELELRDTKPFWKKEYNIGFSKDGNRYEIYEDGPFDSESEAQRKAKEIAKRANYKYYQVAYYNSEYQYDDYVEQDEETGNHKMIWSKEYETATDKRI